MSGSMTFFTLDQLLACIITGGLVLIVKSALFSKIQRLYQMLHLCAEKVQYDPITDSDFCK